MNEKPARVFRPVPVTGPARLWFAILVAVLGVPLLWLLFELLRVPTIRYVLDSTKLTISSSLGSSHQEKTLSLARISEARPEWLRDGSLRFGTEKPGYCVGFFAYPRLGEVFQITDCSSLGVFMASSGEATPVVITPADRDGFLKALNAGRPATFQPPGKRTASWWLTLVTVLGILLAVVLVLATVFFAAPARSIVRRRRGRADDHHFVRGGARSCSPVSARCSTARCLASGSPECRCPVTRSGRGCSTPWRPRCSPRRGTRTASSSKPTAASS